MLATESSVKKRKRVECNVQVNKVNLSMYVDSLADRSILDLVTFQQYFVDKAIEPPGPDDVLTSYTKDRLPVVGTYNAEVRFKSRTAVVKFVIVKRGRCLLGLDAIEYLDLCITGKTLTVSEVETDSKLPTIKGFQHKVKVNPNVHPVQQKLRRLPLTVRSKVSQKLEELESQGVIEKIDTSEWVSPIVVSYKSNGDVRLCVDLREVNKAVIPDVYPIPPIQELLCELHDAKVFSQLDMESAYHQLELHPNSRDLTAFITHDGLYRYKRVCFGLSSAPSAFQKTMSSILCGLDGVQCYLDDVVVYGKTQEEHDRNLKAVYERLQKHNVQLNRKKCKESVSSLKFLGHTISDQGIKMDESQIQSIVEALVPTDKKSLQSFLGLVGYFLMYVPNFAHVVEPMRSVLREENFIWHAEAEQSFVRVKNLLQENCTLALFNTTAEVVYVTCDASAYGLGAVLSQKVNGKERVVACASRTLSSAERNYSVGEREALACVFALEKWHVFLWGRKIVIRTDHSALTTMLSKGTDRKSMRIARWYSKLMKYNYDIEYRPGSDNKLADGLSRAPRKHCNDECDVDDEQICETVQNDMQNDIPVTLVELQTATGSDAVLSEIAGYANSKWPEKKDLSQDVQRYEKVKDEISMYNGNLMRADRIIPPVTLREKLVLLAHEAHQGQTRTKQRLRDLYWWPNMDDMVVQVLQKCTVCQKVDKGVKTAYTPLEPVPFPEGPWEKLGLDIVGPFEKAPLNTKFAISLIDYHSKWPEVGFVEKVTSQSVITFLTSVFSREGFPLEIVTDHGPQFISKEFEGFFRGEEDYALFIIRVLPSSKWCCRKVEFYVKECCTKCCGKKGKY